MSDNKSPPDLSAKFRPRARIIQTVGEDLIKDEFAGLLELVKNGYDADSPRVVVRLKDILTDDAKIIVEDFGHGMTAKVIREHWMSPATDHKRDQGTSPLGRRLLGLKGVGRFAAMRIGEQLTLTSKSPTEDHANSVTLNWEPFRDGETYLDELDVDIEEIDSPFDIQGTRLEISELQDNWSIHRIEKLIRELRTLVGPIPDSETKFQLLIELGPLAHQFPDLKHNKVIDEGVEGTDLFELKPYDLESQADYEIEATISEDGFMNYTYRRLANPLDEIDQLIEVPAPKAEEHDDPIQQNDGETIQVVSEDKGEQVLDSIRGLKIFYDYEDELKELLAAPKFKLPCGPLKMKFHVWDRDADVLKEKAKEMSTLSVPMTLTSLRKIIDNQSGVAIYRDGFRVRPYGSPGYDWLLLSRRRVDNPSKHLEPKQVDGTVFISADENELIEDRSSREGVKENFAYVFLQACCIAVLSKVESPRFEFRKRAGRGRTVPRSSALVSADRKNSYEELSSKISSLDIPKKKKKDLEKGLSSFNGLIEEEHDKIDFQAKVMHDRYALGMLATFVVHEGRNLNLALDSAAEALEEIEEECRHPELNRISISDNYFQDFIEAVSSIRGVTEKSDELFDQLDPLIRVSKAKRSMISVKEIITAITAMISPRLKSSRIEFNVPNDDFKVVAYKSDLFHALYNLVDNAIYWSSTLKDPSISISFELKSRVVDGAEIPSLAISVKDSGPGVRESLKDSIWDVGVTEKASGTGFGLYIAREAITRSHGVVDLVNPGERGAHFEIELEVEK